MNRFQLGLGHAGLVVLSIGAGIAGAEAGPCSAEIARIEKTLSEAAGKAALRASSPQTTNAQRHVQPTPASVQRSEEAAQARLNAMLARAREADAAGDQTACTKAVTEVKLILGLQ